MTNFVQAYESFMNEHKALRNGERLRRLQEGHGHAEKLFLEQIWWPAIGHFRDLHPEYEVKDFNDASRFIDFAYIRPPFRIAFEIDGYGPHMRDIDRWRFGDQLMRQNQLVLDGWKIFRFSYDDIFQKGRRCQQLVLHLMGRWYGERGEQTPPLLGRELDIARLAASSVSPITPAEVAGHLGIRPEHARKWLSRLVAGGVLRPARDQQRIRAYVLTEAGRRLFL
ncbi:DNA-binding response regulator [Paenibacillus ginsengarvi]|uniref:DNA-binding response regulator n=1 Tax=Paenibacillus ginsengarvi TaxID=400777 RepID=A0A3B0BJV4_9BACL|nr:DNA-binding response regulator [Paenibacillus ginsengarvi]RKN74133.1 DNA-binding response regulator [Paenibacillus ginsengarvi]